MTNVIGIYVGATRINVGTVPFFKFVNKLIKTSVWIYVEINIFYITKNGLFLS